MGDLYTVEWWYGADHSVFVTNNLEGTHMWDSLPEDSRRDLKMWQREGKGTYWDSWGWYIVWHGDGHRPGRRWEH